MFNRNGLEKNKIKIPFIKKYSVSDINTLHEINALLNETLVFKSKYKQLNEELKGLQEQEAKRKTEVHFHLTSVKIKTGKLLKYFFHSYICHSSITA